MFEHEQRFRLGHNKRRQLSNPQFWVERTQAGAPRQTWPNEPERSGRAMTFWQNEPEAAHAGETDPKLIS
jgi:hypothetical protein